MDAALHKLTRENMDLKNAALDNDAERYENECQKVELTSEIETLNAVLYAKDMEFEAKLKAYEREREIYRERLRRQDQRVQRLELNQEGALAIQERKDEEVAALTFALAEQKAISDKREEEFAQMQRLNNATIEELNSTIAARDEEIANLSEKIEEQKTCFESLLRDRDEEICKLESSIKEIKDAAVKQEISIIQKFKQELQVRDAYQDKKFAAMEKKQKTFEQALKWVAESHNMEKKESSVVEVHTNVKEGKNGNKEDRNCKCEN